MSRLYVQSEGTAARRRFPVYLVDATDGITPETGEAAGQPQISKAGAAWGNTTATLSAIGNGAYYVELTAAELDTLGSFQVRYKSANTAEFNMDGEVVAIDIHGTPAVNTTQFGGSSIATVSESSAVPAANASLLAKLTFMATAMRNKIVQSATTQTLYADDGATPVAASTHSDSGTEYTKGEWT
jgi:hypothetical protein